MFFLTAIVVFGADAAIAGVANANDPAQVASASALLTTAAKRRRGRATRCS